MDKKQFIETYCHNCGTQRCEGIDTEWFEGCPKRWNLNGYGDAAAEIERLNKKIIELGCKLLKLQLHGEWIPKEQTYPMFGCLVTVGYECSICGKHHEHMRDYCPACGARMDGGKNNV